MAYLANFCVALYGIASPLEHTDTYSGYDSDTLRIWYSRIWIPVDAESAPISTEPIGQIGLCLISMGETQGQLLSQNTSHWMATLPCKLHSRNQSPTWLNIVVTHYPQLCGHRAWWWHFSLPSAPDAKSNAVQPQ